MIRILPIVTLIFVFSPAKSDYRSEIYTAYINNRMDQWKSVIDRMTALSDKENETILELVNYQYGYIGFCIGFEKKEEARKYLSDAQENIKILEDHGYKLSKVNAYKAAFYGFRIALNPLSAPLNGKKSIEYARMAIKLDPLNYLAFVQQGNICFFMPAAFGGSKKEALKYYMKSKELLENNPSSIKDDWNYLNLMIVIGQTYTYLKDFDSAKITYEYILGLEPGFLYVKDDLYPKLNEKIRTEK